MRSSHDYATLNSELQKRLHFTAEELAANARGTLTPGQSERLTHGRGCYRVFGCFFAAAGLPASLTLLAASGLLFWFERDRGMVVFGGLGILLLLACLYVLLVVWRMQPSSRLVVQRIEGKARVRIYPASDSLWKADVTIAGVTFKMTSYAARLFRPDVRFQVYYIQNGLMPMLLSVEISS